MARPVRPDTGILFMTGPSPERTEIPGPLNKWDSLMQAVHTPAKPQSALLSPYLALTLLFACLSPAVSFGESAADQDGEQFHVRGRVVDPEGETFAGADVIAVSVAGRFAGGTKTSESGQFEMAFTRSAVASPAGAKDWRYACLVANAPGYGPGWVRLGELEAQPEPTLRLVKDVPIDGRILNLEGRPVAGAKLRFVDIHGSDKQNLDAYLKASRDRPAQAWVHMRDHYRSLPSQATIVTTDSIPGDEPDDPVLTTDEEGRFSLKGIGRERIARFHLTGPEIESTLFNVVTRPEIEPKWNRGQPNRETRMELEAGAALDTIYPASFNHFAGPSLTIAGSARNRETGEPLQGIRVAGSIRGRHNSAHADTDEEGRYTLKGLATEGLLRLHAYPPESMPYLPLERRGIKLTPSAPLASSETDFELVRGVTARGRLVDSATGKPVAGWVQYLAYADNSFVQKLPDGLGDNRVYVEDGRFKVTALPGPGLIVGKAREDRYEVARPEDFGRPPNQRGWFSTANRGSIRPDHYHVVQPIDPEPGTDPIHVELALRSGKTVAGRLVDSEGNSVNGVDAEGIAARRVGRSKLESAEFTVTGVRDGEERTVIFRHPDRELGAIVTFSGEEREPVMVTLRSLATLGGRIVDSEGRPIPGVPLAVLSEGAGKFIQQRRSGQEPVGRRPIELGADDEVGMTDVDGRFRAKGLIPGIKGELIGGPPEALREGTNILPSVLATFTLRSGETRDLGDRTLSKGEPADEREDNR